MLFVILAAALASVPGLASAASLSAEGTWTVSSVETDPSMPVTAVANDDPAYLGATLTVTPARIAWNTAATNGEGSYDECVGPRFQRTDGGLAIMCGTTAWGPEATLTPVSGDRLKLAWYDGGILILTRK